MVGVDLNHGSQKDKIPVRTQFRHFFNQFYIKSFIDHTVKTQFRSDNISLIQWFFFDNSCLFKMFLVYAAREGMDIVMLVFLKIIETLSPGKNHVCFFK